MSYLYGFMLALTLTIVLIPPLIRGSARLQLVDEPDGDRKMHTQTVPRIGGLAMALGFAAAILFWVPFSQYVNSLLLGCLVIVIFGILDDRYQLNYKWKFLGQILAVAIFFGGGLEISNQPFDELLTIPLWLDYAIAFLFVLGAINAVNLADGLDGLAGGVTLLSVGLVAVFAYSQGNQTILSIAAAVMGGLVGFLRFNTFPARIFMGDTGSQFLGFVIAGTAILVTQGESRAISPLLPLMILGLPILDTVMVMVLRLRAGRSPFSPDKNHLHHQLIALGLRHYEAVAVIYILQMVLLVGTFFIAHWSDMLVAIAYLGFSTVILATIYWGRSQGWFLHAELMGQTYIDRRNPLIRKLSNLYPYTARFFNLAVAGFLIAAALSADLSTKDMILVGIGAGIALLGFWALFGAHWPALVARIIAHSASIFLIYALTWSVHTDLGNWLIDGYLLILAVLLALSIRITRRHRFRLDTQDLLILFIVLLGSFIPANLLGDVSIGRLALRTIIILYCCEYLFEREVNSKLVLNGSAVLGLLLLGVHL